MINKTGIQMAQNMKQFLQIVQPLPVKYGYSRGIKRSDLVVTYYQTSSIVTRGIGNHILSERETYLITVQAKTAEQCILFSQLIRRGTDGSYFEFVSDNIRKDTTVADGWINSIIVYAYVGLTVEQVAYTAEQVRQELQEIADNYIFVTSRYDETLSASFIDKLVIPPLEERTYSYAEFIALKNKYLDKLLLATMEF